MKKCLTLFLAFMITLMATMPISQKSEAAVGLIIRSRTTAVVGGLGAAGGYIFSSIIYHAAVTSGATGLAALQIGISAAVFMSLGLTVGVLGLVVLDDNSVNEFKFLPIDEKLNPAPEVKIFNQEIDQLNAIKETIEAAVDADPKVNTAELWDEYSSLLSPETMSVARAIAQSFMANAQPAN
jgi:hypothetical protein